MGKKIDAEELYHRMYDEAFEKDSDLQKWDSGCWIRFKLFENVLKGMPEIEDNKDIVIISEALIGICEHECCAYGMEEALALAEKYVEDKE